MKRWTWILCGLLAFGFMEKTGAQVEVLQPVQLLQVQKEKGIIWLKTDTEDFGSGESLQAAMKNLQETSEKRIFLETADMLILGENTQELLPELRTLLRPAVQVCGSKDELDLAQAAAYLKNHRSSITLAGITEEERKLPELKAEGGRLRLAGNQR